MSLDKNNNIFKGGIRFAPAVKEEEVNALALALCVKFAVTTTDAEWYKEEIDILAQLSEEKVEAIAQELKKDYPDIEKQYSFDVLFERAKEKAARNDGNVGFEFFKLFNNPERIFLIN